MLYLQRKAAEYTRDGAPFVRAGQYILIYTTHFIFHKFILMFRTQLTTSYPLIPSLLVSTWNLLSFSINAREWRKVGCHDVLFGILAPKSYKFYSWALVFCLSVATSWSEMISDSRLESGSSGAMSFKWFLELWGQLFFDIKRQLHGINFWLLRPTPTILNMQLLSVLAAVSTASLVIAAPPPPPGAADINPFLGKTYFANSGYAAKLDQTIAAFQKKNDSLNAARARTVKSIGTFVWVRINTQFPTIQWYLTCNR